MGHCPLWDVAFRVKIQGQKTVVDEIDEQIREAEEKGNKPFQTGITGIDFLPELENVAFLNPKENTKPDGSKKRGYHLVRETVPEAAVAKECI